MTLLRARLFSLFSSGLLYTVLAIVVMNAPILTGHFKTDPVLRFSGVGTALKAGPESGQPLIDPSIGYTHETGTRLAMNELVHGRLPWWNYFEGTGVPLAGEMQSAAFFFLGPLVFVPNGQAVLNFVLELLSGISLFFLLRRLNLSEAAAAVGAIAYSANGSFAWLGAEQFYPAAFLPPLLYGVERVASISSRFWAGWAWIATPIALSLTTGFPETAYIDALFAVAWSFVRLGAVEPATRLRYLCNLAIGALLGVLVVAPLLVSFFDYLHVAFVGGHGGAFEDPVLVPEAFVQVFLPYIWGPIFRYGDISGAAAAIPTAWGNVGGYLGLTAALLAGIAVQGQRLRSIRFLCIAWAVLLIGSSFGVPVLHWMVVHFPGIKYTAYFRYSPATWELCAALLIAFALDDLQRGLRFDHWFMLLWATFFAAFLYSQAKPLGNVVAALTPMDGYESWLRFTVLFATLIFVSVLTSLLFLRGRFRVIVLGVVTVVEAATFLMIPMFANFVGGHLDLAGIQFLQARIGIQRVYSSGPIAPNYGSYFGIAQINYNDAPIAATLFDLAKSLDPYISPGLFTGSDAPDPGTPSRLQVFKDNVDKFESAGVSYLVTLPNAAEKNMIVGDENAVPSPLVVGAGEPSVVARFDNNPIVGTIVAVAVNQGNYDDTADGRLTVKVCDTLGCSSGTRRLFESQNNAFFDIPLDKPLLVGGGQLEISLSDDGDKPDAIWSFPDSAPPIMTVARGTDQLPNTHLSLALRFGSETFAEAGPETRRMLLQLKPGATVSVLDEAARPVGKIEAVGFVASNDSRRADGSVELQLCSGGKCVRGSRSARNFDDGGMFEVPLDVPLVVNGDRLRMSLRYVKARRPFALWLYGPTTNTRSSIRYGAHRTSKLSLKTQYEYLNGYGLTNVFTSTTMSIYQTPHPKAYFTAQGCQVVVESRNKVETVCSGNAKLERLETYMPGWSAVVNGRTEPVQADGPVFQSVQVPAGRADVDFSFLPPGEREAFVVAALAFIALCFGARPTKARSLS